jgi:hypothetical protein
MRLFGLFAVILLAGCTKPEPPPVASVVEVQPEQQREPLAPPETVTQSSSTEPTAGPAAQREIDMVRNATPDDRTARLANCKLREELQNRIGALEAELAELHVKYSDIHPRVVAAKRALDSLVQQGLKECVDQIQQDSPGHI